MNSIKKLEVERHNRAYEESKKVKDKPRKKLTKQQRAEVSAVLALYSSVSGY